MMLEIAVGDAYGAGFEYVNKSIVKRFNDLSGYRKHQKYNIGNGRYTDDTQMSIALAELLCENKAWNLLNIANKFVEVFKRDSREGYAGGFYKFLQEVNTGQEFLRKINPVSEKSGAAMRASPIGFLPNTSDVIRYAEIQAGITHNTDIGIGSAIASALMSHYFIYDHGTKEELGDFMLDHKYSLSWEGEVIGRGDFVVRAAITAIKEGNSLSSILKKCISFTGDTDTVAAIAMGAASNSKEIKKDLPKILINKLENGKFGRDYLIGLDKKLERRFLK